MLRAGGGHERRTAARRRSPPPLAEGGGAARAAGNPGGGSPMTERTRPDTTPRLRIGELARRTGRSIHTIRWYEAQHLMPGAARDAAGRRLFSEAHVEWLALIDRLRRCGMSVRDLRTYARLVRQGKSALAEIGRASCRE